MNTNTASKVTVQIAVEYIINHADGFSKADAETVLADGIAHGVAPLYLNMLRDVIATLEAN